MTAPSPQGPAVLLPAILPEPVRRALGLLIIELVDIEITLAGLDPAPREAALKRLADELRAKRQVRSLARQRGPVEVEPGEVLRNAALRVHAIALDYPPTGEAARKADQFNPVPAPLPVKP